MWLGMDSTLALEDVELVGVRSLCEDLTCFMSGWVVRDVNGACMMGFLRVWDIWCAVGGSLCGMVAL